MFKVEWEHREAGFLTGYNEHTADLILSIPL